MKQKLRNLILTIIELIILLLFCVEISIRFILWILTFTFATVNFNDLITVSLYHWLQHKYRRSYRDSPNSTSDIFNHRE